jgi:hypothetical protein
MVGKQLLLGFDCRAWGADEAQPWPAERRDLYLLRGDVPRPVSVDTMVWPRPDGLEAAQAASYFALTTLITDLDEVRQMGSQAQTSYAVVALTISLTPLSLPDQQEWQARQWIVPRPASLAPEWPRLGWDVADMGLISGLSNCGYTPGERATLAGQFGPGLNDHHLFSDHDLADQFRHITNARVPEHAPFFVFGIYWVGAK